MSWKDQLRADSEAWLLENDSPGVRYLALRDLAGLAGEDAELKSARRRADKEDPIAALTGLGYGNDKRLANTINLIREKQDENGRRQLDYDYKDKTWVDFGARKKPNKWVTLRALRVLKHTV